MAELRIRVYVRELNGIGLIGCEGRALDSFVQPHTNPAVEIGAGASHDEIANAG